MTEKKRFNRFKHNNEKEIHSKEINYNKKDYDGSDEYDTYNEFD